jgi:hypothetical protein
METVKGSVADLRAMRKEIAGKALLKPILLAD